MKNTKIPEAAILRVATYLRLLNNIDDDSDKIISSQEIANLTGTSSVQVRKDLGYFGVFGIRGLGYSIVSLRLALRNILGADYKWNVILIGMGNLGGAILSYEGFRERGFEIKGIFDIDEAKIGNSIRGVEILSICELDKFTSQNEVHIAIIAVPGSEAQKVAQKIADLGIFSILNFAPTILKLPKCVDVKNVDLSINMELLSFNIIKN